MASIIDPRAVIRQKAAEQTVSYQTLSRILGRSDGWVSRYLNQGMPSVLAPADRATLAGYFGVSEWELGGPCAAVKRSPQMRETPVYTGLFLCRS